MVIIISWIWRYKWITNMLSSGICYSSGPCSENERKGKDRQILGSCLRAEKTDKYEMGSDTNCS